MKLNKNILIGISASISLYKSPALARRLQDQGARVKSVMTEHASQLLSPQVMEAVTQNECYINEFSGRHGAMDHIDLKNWADLFILYPGSANTIGNLAQGLGPDLLSTVFLAMKPARVNICPAMNTDMYNHPGVQNNLRTLAQFGCVIIDPAQDDLACGETGPGKLIDPEDLVQFLLQH